MTRPSAEVASLETIAKHLAWRRGSTDGQHALDLDSADPLEELPFVGELVHGQPDEVVAICIPADETDLSQGEHLDTEARGNRALDTP